MERIPLIIEVDRDDPDCAEILVDGMVAGQACRFLLDTGAARTQLIAGEVTAAWGSDARREESSGVFAAGANPMGTVRDLVIGPLTVPELEVGRIEAGQPGARNLLGMDVLRHWCCHFRFDTDELLVRRSRAAEADQVLDTDDRGHVYVQVRWPGVAARACWDSGAGITIVDQAFQRRHPGLFRPSGTATGTDSTGARAVTPTFVMSGPAIGAGRFAPHKVAVVDLTQANATLDRPMDLILGYPTVRQANWLLDFPARRWALT